MVHTVAPAAQTQASTKQEFEKRRLKKLCDEFGALLTEQLLHAMREGTLRAEQPGESEQVYQSMFDQSLALEVSKHQNGGLSNILYQQLLPLVTTDPQQD